VSGPEARRGYIGLEVAATVRSMGADVVVIEREPQRVLSRVAGPALSAFFSTRGALSRIHMEQPRRFPRHRPTPNLEQTENIALLRVRSSFAPRPN